MVLHSAEALAETSCTRSTAARVKGEDQPAESCLTEAEFQFAVQQISGIVPNASETAGRAPVTAAVAEAVADTVPIDTDGAAAVGIAAREKRANT